MTETTTCTKCPNVVSVNLADDLGRCFDCQELPEKADSIESTLAERGKRYGEFKSHAEISQALKELMHQNPGWLNLNQSQREALEMIQHKVARILNGDPNYPDSWHDISGYSKLVEKELTL